MNHEDVAARLPWYPAGLLDAEETEQIRAHLESCADCRADLEATRLVARAHAAEHPTSTELVDFAWERLERTVSVVITAHLGECPECREELAMLRASRVLEESSAPQSRDWRRMALAASLATMICGAGWIWEVSRGPERVLDPTGGITVVEVLPESFAMRGTETASDLSTTTGPLALVLVTDRAEAFDEVRAVVRDESDSELWTADGLVRSPSGDYAVFVPEHLLGAGGLGLTLEGRLGEEWTMIERYRLPGGS